MQLLEDEGKLISGKFIKDSETIFYMTKDNFDSLCKFAKYIHDVGYEKYFAEDIVFLEYGYTRLEYFFGKEITENFGNPQGWLVFINDMPVATVVSKRRKPIYIIEELRILKEYNREKYLNKIIKEIERDALSKGFTKVVINSIEPIKR